MQTLDRLLYAWLSERNDTRFQHAFATYFRAAFPAIVRYLARRAVFDESQLEDLAQEALLKFFDRIGLRRRRAFATTSESLPQVQPLNFGPFHERQVTAWTGGVGAYATDSLEFAARASDLAATADWKSMLREVSDRAPGLQRQGCHLLDTARGQRALPGEQGSEHPLPELRSYWERIEAASRAQSEDAVEAERRHPGLLHFVRATLLVTEAIPELRIPTNGFLFEIALSLYLDECKHRGRKKRGGSGVVTDLGAGGEPHPLEAEGSESLCEDGADEERRVRSSWGSGSDPATASWGADPDLTYEDQQFLEKFYDYLRRPLEESQEAFAKATTTTSVAAARRKLESLAHKFARLSSVVSLLGEGYTQEVIAQRLGVSRNQVKYVVEQLQASYVQFCGRAAEHAYRSPAAEEPTHVK